MEETHSILFRSLFSLFSILPLLCISSGLWRGWYSSLSPLLSKLLTCSSNFWHFPSVCIVCPACPSFLLFSIPPYTGISSHYSTARHIHQYPYPVFILPPLRLPRPCPSRLSPTSNPYSSSIFLYHLNISLYIISIPHPSGTPFSQSTYFQFPFDMRVYSRIPPHRSTPILLPCHAPHMAFSFPSLYPFFHR